ERVLAAGGRADRVVFSGLGKTEEEMRRALQVGIKCFNVESAAELERLQKVAAELGVKAPVALRVNHDVDAMTQPYISTGLKENKFGIDIAQAVTIYRRAASLPNLDIQGVDCHIGSQLTGDTPVLGALDRMLVLIDQLAEEGIQVRHLDLGGGLGVTYQNETPPTPGEYLGRVREKVAGRDLTLLFEPGRSIVANAGVLLTRVNLLKPTEHKNFAIIDAAMNDLIRPALYSAWMGIEAVRPRDDVPTLNWDLVGPVCETGDFLGKDRELALAEGDLLAVRSAGAYGFVMSFNYNSRPRAAEVMVEDSVTHLVRRRVTVAELFAGESLLPEAPDAAALHQDARAGQRLHGHRPGDPARPAESETDTSVERPALRRGLRPVAAGRAAGRSGCGLPLSHLQCRWQRSGAVRQRCPLLRPLRPGQARHVQVAHRGGDRRRAHHPACAPGWSGHGEHGRAAAQTGGDPLPGRGPGPDLPAGSG